MKKNYIKELQIIFFSDLTAEEKKEKILQYHYLDIAKLIETLDKSFYEQIFSYFAEEEILHILDYLTQIDLIETFGISKTISLIERMEVAKATSFLAEMNPPQKTEILSELKGEKKEEILKLNKCDAHSLAHIMTRKYISVIHTDTVEEVKKLKNLIGLQSSWIYVVDINHRLLGVVSALEVAKAEKNSLIQDIMKKNYPSFLYSDSVESCLDDFKGYELDSYPIIDENSRLLGVITSEKIIGLVEKGLSDNYAKLAGLTEEEKNYHSTFDSVKRRLPWLIILLVLGLFQAFAMTAFEHLVVSLPVLIFFQTFILSLSGGSGVQSLAVTIQNLSHNTSHKRVFLKSVYKALKSGFFNGLAIGILAFIIVFVFMFVTKQSVGTEVYYTQDAIKISCVIALSLWVSVFASCLVGVIIPFIFLRIKLKPTAASGILIEFLCAATTLLIYYEIAYFAFLKI